MTSISVQLENAKVLSRFRINDNVKYKVPDKLELKLGVVKDFAYNAQGEILLGVRWFTEWQPEYTKSELEFIHHIKVTLLTDNKKEV